MLFFIQVFACFIYGCTNSKSPIVTVANDDFYEKCRKLVVSERQQGLEYSFSRLGQGIDELSVMYLGNVITKKGDTLRVLNSINYSGQLADAKHGNGNVFIYNSQNKRIGFYYVGGAFGVPSKVENGSLIFNYANEYCNQTTVIDMKDSIPKQIFINCTIKGGDLYVFSTE